MGTDFCKKKKTRFAAFFQNLPDHQAEISKNLQKLKILNFANFWRARSGLYQNEILQENMRLTAFFKRYKICILLHRCNLKNLAKNRIEKSAIVKFQQKFCKCCKNLQMLQN